MKKFIVLLLVALALGPVAAFAIDLDAAKQSGLVGERPDGYLGIVTAGPSADVVSLVEDINRKRKVKYQEISQKNGQALQVVETLAAKKVIERIEPGRYFMDEAGKWVKK